MEQTNQPRKAIVKLTKGLNIFRMEASTGKITALFSESKKKYAIYGKVSFPVEPGFLYLPALNVANAKRKFEKNALKLLNSLKDGKSDS